MSLFPQHATSRLPFITTHSWFQPDSSASVADVPAMSVGVAPQSATDASYFHVVFTLPSELRAIARCNSGAIYALLARLGAATLLEVAATPRHLGAQPAITTVLHTWSRDLSYHVHLHCIVSAGGLSADGTSWVRSRRADYLFPIRVLGAHHLSRAKRARSMRSIVDCTTALCVVPPTQPTLSLACATSSTERVGSCTQRNPSRAPSRCTRTSVDTPIVSAFRIIASSPSMPMAA